MTCLPTSMILTALLKSRFDSLTPFACGRERVLMADGDVYEPEEKLIVMMDKFNRSGTSLSALALPCPPISKRWLPNERIGR